MFRSADEEKNLSGIEVRSTKSLLYELVIISIPISLASSIMGLTNFIDAILVTSRLTDAWTLTGLGGVEANRIAKSIYGAYSMPKTLFNMPTTLIYPFAISALPALSKYYGNGDKAEAKKLMESTFRVSAIVALPCALGMSAMAHPILSLIFRENQITESMTNIDFVAPCLMVLGLSVFFLGMISVTNSVLQAYHLQNHTIISTVLGIIMKIIATYFLTSSPVFGVVGAAIGTALCYFTIMIMNMFFIITKVKLFPSIGKTFLKPFVASIICVVPCLLTYRYVSGFVSPKITTVVAIGVAALVYLGVLLVIKGIAIEDIKMLPKSEKIIKILRKAKLLDE
jgi:stage V sporulation protein B